MTKEETYREVYAQLQSLLEGETDPIARMANTAAVLHEAFGWWWVGYYQVKARVDESADKGEEELVLGPFQGPVACMHIRYGHGVCGTAWKEDRTQVVPDVHKFPGHIACSSRSNSEIVVPIHEDSRVTAVLDIDSVDYGAFDDTDKEWLEKIVRI